MKHLLLILSFLLLSSPLFGQSFVSVGNSGTILTSSDGITWTEKTSGTPIDLYGVTSGNGLFVTVGESGTILTSPDGNSWTIKEPLEYQSISEESPTETDSS